MSSERTRIMHTSTRDKTTSVPIMLILLVLLSVFLFVSAAPHQPLWWTVVAGIAVVGCGWGALASSLRRSSK